MDKLSLPQIKSIKSNLIARGIDAYPIVSKIVDTLGNPKVLSHRNYMVLDYDGITILHLFNIARAKVNAGKFDRWLYRDSLFVTVGDQALDCPFRRDRVMYIALDTFNTEVVPEDRNNAVFVPYHMNWFNRIMLLLPKADAVLAEANKKDEGVEIEELKHELFLDNINNSEWIERFAVDPNIEFLGGSDGK